MKMFQQWKVQIYVFTSLLLFVTGVAYAMWPRNEIAHTQPTSQSATPPAQTLQVAEQDKKDAAQAVVPDESAEVAADDDTENAGMSPVAAANSASGTTHMEGQPKANDQPAPDTTIAPEPEEPEATSDAKPAVEPPIITVRCGCTVLRLRANVLCPLKTTQDLLCGKPAY
jgi:hypothetical protein